MRKASVLFLFCIVPLLFAPPAAAKRDKVKHLDLSTCPYSGLPPIEAFVGDNITIVGTRFNLTRMAHAGAFQQLLMVCNASAALTPYVEWKQARSLVVAKSAEAAAYAISTSAKALNAETDEEKQAIVKDAADAAARFAVELVPLVSNANAKKQLFQATFMASVAP